MSKKSFALVLLASAFVLSQPAMQAQSSTAAARATVAGETSLFSSGSYNNITPLQQSLLLNQQLQNNSANSNGSISGLGAYGLSLLNGGGAYRNSYGITGPGYYGINGGMSGLGAYAMPMMYGMGGGFGYGNPGMIISKPMAGGGAYTLFNGY